MIAVGTNEPELIKKIYAGYITATVAAVNPGADELSRLLGHEWEKAEYTGKTQDGLDFARVNFWLRPEAGLPGLPPVIKLPVTLTRQGRKNSDGTKTQVVDKYGNTAWVSDEEFKAQAVPTYGNGKPASIIPPYQMACRGQDKLLDIIKAWCNIPFAFNWNPGGREFTRKSDAELKSCECELDIKRLWSGDASEISGLVGKLAEYKVKALLTVRSYTDNSGQRREAQGVYGKIVPAWRSAESIGKEFIRDSQSGGNRDTMTLLVNAMEWTPENVAAVYAANAAAAPNMAPPAPAAQDAAGAVAPRPAGGVPPMPAYGTPEYEAMQRQALDELPF